MVSYCERCFEEMPPVEARWSKLCTKCRLRNPALADIPQVYDRGRFGMWDHLQVHHQEVPRATFGNDDRVSADSLRVRPHRDENGPGPSREALGIGRPPPGGALEHDRAWDATGNDRPGDGEGS